MRHPRLFKELFELCQTSGKYPTELFFFLADNFCNTSDALLQLWIGRFHLSPYFAFEFLTKGAMRAEISAQGEL